MRLAELANLRVAVWGYGREGRAALAALRRHFPDKALTLFCGEEEAPAARADIGGAIPTPLPMGQGSSTVSIDTSKPDLAALKQFDIVVKSPGISPYQASIPEAEAAGVRFTSGTAIWFAENPQARTICVTGTKGKSTVTALIAHFLRAGERRVALAGNIGLPLLDLLDTPRAPDWWVIELSSFQTYDFAGAPQVAVVNNIYEEHLDWHGTRERYLTDKLAIVRTAANVVVNAQPELLARTAECANLHVFGDDAGWHARENGIWRGNDRILTRAEIPLPGRHNLQNVCAALAALDAAGEDAGALAQHVATFRALPHRLQSLGERGGLEYVNDSISTTPYATIEALRAFGERRITVIVGGFDRGVDWSVFADYVAQHPPRAILATGANGPRIMELLGEIAAPEFMLASAATLADALARASESTPVGGVVLLSPGAPSFDQYRDYAERGREFARIAGFDPAAIAHIEGLGIS